MKEKKGPSDGSRGAGKESGPARSEPKNSIGNPDVSVLQNYSPTEGEQSQPAWVKAKFPGYIASHDKHEATSIRELTHNGHAVRIITTYRVEVDGAPAGMHLSVDEDGRVYTHATPFVTYASAVDLMKEVMDAYPDAFSDSDADTHADTHAHANHDHDHNQGGGQS
jgi:hypothetical protein